MSNKPSIPKGTRDFSPIEMVRRNYIFDVIKKSFKKYGFQQIETPAMENLSTLVGSGGEESDKLIFKILNSGDYLAKVDKETLSSQNSSLITHHISEKALHYDLTVPFARYVVQNQNDITFPFRRFQIQPVWRADRPQKGRYREFYQCDADIIGSDSLLNEVDLIKMIDDVFTELFQGKLNYTVSVNNRKILQGIVESAGAQNKFEQIVVAIDKFDKIGEKGVNEELKSIGITIEQADKLLTLLVVDEVRVKAINELDLSSSLDLEIKLLEITGTHIGKTINGQKGIEELEFVFEKLQELKLKTAKIIFDPTLARGLGYYTGTIIEVKVENFPSITGGGRYDDLTGKFGLKNVSGVGISFGADRIYDVLLDNNLYPEFKGDSTQVLFTNQSAADEVRFLPMLFELRDRGINAELYTEQAKWQKQLIFAEKKGIKFIVSANEKGETFLKNTNEEEKKPFSTIEEIISFIQNRKS
ncbi:MAG: histidine--tRNA ligase [Bacteroidetes bacterium RIFCSPLOWO2_12_FULL_31_6]|nr:MAG: histidine--tRNA ligase [Bacteroidetes bacterium RIFCSPLOWO2_12_FULL_31_6]